MITATHDLDVVGEIADRCYVFQSGTSIAEGLPGVILNNEELLKSSSLIHAHRHIHTTGEMHAHLHFHVRHDRAH